MTDDIRTIAEHRAAAEATGEWEQTVVDFSLDGETWAPFILPTDEHPHPILARAIVQRKDRALVETIILWDESLPDADDPFTRVWERKPHLMFGTAAERAALRRTFPMALERVVYADRQQQAPEPWTADQPETAVDRDARLAEQWGPQIELAATPDQIDDLHKQMKAAREVTPELAVLLKERRRQLAEPADEPATKGAKSNG